MTNPVSFIDDADTDLARYKRDCKLAQQRFDELQSLAEHNLREAALRETELRIENNRLRARLRSVAADIKEALDIMGTIKGDKDAAAGRG